MIRDSSGISALIGRSQAISIEYLCKARNQVPWCETMCSEVKDLKYTTCLKKLIESPKILVMPGAYDVLSAKIIEKLGFQAVQCSGFGFAASYLGLPDVGIMSLTQMVDLTRNVCSAVDIPVMADGDTGFGNAVNVYFAVREFEIAGAAGMNLEDQVFPKRCGHMSGKQIVPVEEMVGKIRAAVAARRDPDFVINARTDAIAVSGVEEAIRRANIYADAGADLVFVEAPRTEKEIRHVLSSIKAPVSINLAQGGKTPAVTIQQLEEWGAARVSIPVTAVMAASRAVWEALQKVKTDGSVSGVTDRVFTFDEFTELVDFPTVRELEESYLPNFEIETKYGLDRD
jgi:2-methylisocitrate lyase-like PEP mutase family enzyme